MALTRKIHVSTRLIFRAIFIFLFISTSLVAYSQTDTATVKSGRIKVRKKNTGKVTSITCTYHNVAKDKLEVVPIGWDYNTPWHDPKDTTVIDYPPEFICGSIGLVRYLEGKITYPYGKLKDLPNEIKIIIDYQPKEGRDKNGDNILYFAATVNAYPYSTLELDYQRIATKYGQMFLLNENMISPRYIVNMTLTKK